LTSLESPEKAIQSKPNVALFRKQPKIKQTKRDFADGLYSAVGKSSNCRNKIK
jgi:hypothetical protein